MQCGVGQFTRLLRETIEKLDPGSCTTLTLTRSEGSLAEIWRAVGSARSVVCNFPDRGLEARDISAAAGAGDRAAARRRVILIQHEWAGLHWLRRITYIPALLLADTDRHVLAAGAARTRRRSPGRLDREENACWRRCRRTSKRRRVSPIPNCGNGLPQRAREGRLVIGHFGSIYPGKQPNALLDICAILKQRGLKPLIVYIGSFIRGVDKVEEEFHARAAELGITDDVIVSGYVASDHEVFGLFSEIDAFCYPLEEGLTARRASILTCVQSGRPVIVTGPAETGRIRPSSALQGN